MSPKPAIELDQLTKSFRVRHARRGGVAARLRDLFAQETRAVLAVDRVSFRIEPGERVAFIGPNGAGKSTTIKLLAGVLHPDAGTAEVAGVVPWRDRRQLGFAVGTVFGQRSQLWYHLPARDSLGLLARVYELSRAEERARLDALIAAFALEPLLDRPVRQLSLGERMRCELAASFLHRPRILFLDEPTIGLDVSAKAAIRELLEQRTREDGATLLLTSHDTGDIERVCSRVIVIHGGRLLFDGALDSLRRRYLRTRRVTVITSAERVELDLPGVRRLDGGAPHATRFELDAEQALGALVDRVSRVTTLKDIAIEDPPLDDVIRALYAELGREAAS